MDFRKYITMDNKVFVTGGVDQRVEENAKVSYALMDKISKVEKDAVLMGTRKKIVLLKKGETKGK